MLLLPAAFCAEYREKNAGDEAFRRNDYSSAASFYGRYLEKAHLAGDIAAEKDAYERRIDALVLGRFPELAEKLLKEYQQKFTGSDPIAVTIWTADILMMQNNPEAARKHIERILNALTVDNPRRIHALSTLARTYELSGNFYKAAELYFSISQPMTGAFGQKSTATKPQISAWERGVFCLLFSPRASKAAEFLAKHPEAKNPAAQDRIQLLSTLIQIKTGPSKNIPAVWKTYKVLDDYSSNELSYPVFSMIGDTASKAGYPEVAAEAYAVAYNCSPNKDEAFKTLNRLLLVVHSAGRKEDAANLVLKAMSLFRGGYVSVKFQADAAEILLDAGRYAEACKIFTELAGNPAVTEKSKHHTMRCLSRISAKIELPANALKLLDTYFTGTKAGEREYIYAGTLLEDKKYSEAAKKFQQIAEKFPAWRRKALYQAAYCLLTSKEYKAALESLNLFFREKGQDKMFTDAVYMNACALEGVGNKLAAWKEYERYTGLREREERYEQEALLRAGRLAFLSGEPQTALILLERLIKKYPRASQSIDAANWRIYIYRSINDDYHADRATYELAYAWPDSQVTFNAMYQLAEQNFSSDSYGKVKGIFEDLLRKSSSPENRSRVLIGLASLAVYHQRYAEAETFLNRLDQNYPAHQFKAKAAYFRGHIFHAAGNYNRAIEFYKKALESNPDPYLSNAAYGSVGDCSFIIAGKKQDPAAYAAALQAYDHILKQTNLDAGLHAMTLYKAGRSAEQSGKDDLALSYYKKALYLPAAFSTPASRLWAAKAAEAIYSIAEKRPLRQHIEDTASALNLLEKYQIIPQGTAARRTDILRRARFRPRAAK